MEPIGHWVVVLLRGTACTIFRVVVGTNKYRQRLLVLGGNRSRIEQWGALLRIAQLAVL